jgi:hypothetical protein
MSDPAHRPLNLPKYVFLMTRDDASRRLACDVADHMQSIDNTVYIDDFETPIYEAFMAMFGRDYKKDYGHPKNRQALMLESQIERSEQEVILSLREWFFKTFDSKVLGRMAFNRAVETMDLNEYIYVFRDALPEYIEPFLSASRFIAPARDVQMAWISDPGGASTFDARGNSFNVKQTRWLEIPSDPHQILRDMER